MKFIQTLKAALRPSRPRDRAPESDLHYPAVVLQNFEDSLPAFEHLFCLHYCNGTSLPANPDRYRLMTRLLGTSTAEGFFIVQALARTAHLEGDVCEFGVAQGETSALMASEIASTQKVLHLFDSFVGLPAPTEEDRLKDDIFALGSMAAYQGTMACPEDMVKARLQDIGFPDRRYRIHKGFIEESLQRDTDLPQAVAFAYVDVDFYQPIKTALHFLHPILQAGAIAIVDDYDFFSTGAKQAVDEFVAEQNAERAAYTLEIPPTTFGHFAILTKLSVEP